ncbi:hypothetical protein [Pseudomonas syringae]
MATCHGCMTLCVSSMEICAIKHQLGPKRPTRRFCSILVRKRA